MKIVALAGLAAGLAAGCDRTITVPAVGAALIAAQDGDGAWHPLALDAAGNVSFDVGGDDYGFAYVCPASPGQEAWAELRLATVDDADPRVLCVEPTTVTLLGTTAPGAWVFAGGGGGRADAGGQFQLQVVPGRHDVVVIADAVDFAKATIVRDVDLRTSRTLALPVAPDWRPVAHVPWPQGPFVSVELVTRTCSGTEFWFSGGGYIYQLAGAGLLDDCDRVAYGASSPGQVHYAQVPQGDGAPIFELPGPNNAAVEGRTLTWDSGWDEVTFWLWDANVTYRATEGRFGDQAGGAALPLVDITALPGWRPGMPGLQPGSGSSWTARTRRGTAYRDLELVDEDGSLFW